MDLRCAILGAQAKAGKGSFRQKDVRFLFELFSNWLSSLPWEVPPSLHNVQIQRALDELAERGWLSKRTERRVPTYELTRAGLLEILGEIWKGAPRLAPGRFLFVVYFFRSYGELIDRMVQERGSEFPKSLRIEISALHDPDQLIEERRRLLEREVKKLKSRIEDSRATAKLAEKSMKEPGGVKAAVAAVQKAYPYELNHQKPLLELYDEIPPELHAWELTTGTRHRSELLWNPLLSYLEAVVKTEGSRPQPK